MTGTLGSRINGAKKIAIRSHSHLSLVQFENGKLIDNRFARRTSNATKERLQ